MKSKQPRKPRVSRKLSYLLILGALVAVLGLILVYGDQGLVHLFRLNQDKAKLKAANEELQEKNRRLMMKIDRIKKDPRYIEEEARKKLGLVRPDEKIYRLKDDPALPPPKNGSDQK